MTSSLIRCAAGEHSKGQIIQTALGFIDVKLGSRPIGKREWADVIFVLGVLKEHDTEGIWAQVRAIAGRHSDSVVESARSIRDRLWGVASEDARALLQALPPKFGTVQQLLPEALRAAVTALVPRDEIQEYAMRFDTELFVSALCCIAQAAHKHFKAKLMELYPHARVITNVREMRDEDDSWLMVAGVKKAGRICEKIIEAANENRGKPEMWPFIQLIGDFLRASVILCSFNAYARAWETLATGFRLRDGHGRLKVRRARADRACLLA